MERDPWKELWSNKSERWLAIMSTILAVGMIAVTSEYLVMMEQRPGVVIADPIHRLIGPIDLTWLIFFVLYGALGLAFVLLWKTPHLIFRGFRAYALLLSLRMLGIFLLPFDAPPDMIMMPDPIIQALASDAGEVLRKDLFFSGHTSSMFMTAFIMPTRGKRWLYIVLGCIVGASLVIQHVHYTVDVMVAPMAALFAVALSGRSR